jgi:diaminopimelate decarboxylase
MSFCWRNSILHVEELPVPDLAAQFGTPLYLYSKQTLTDAVQRFRRAFEPFQPEIHYAVKANANPYIVRCLLEMGLGVDVVSGGELELAWLAGAPMERIAFAGVGKTDAEVLAALDGTFSPISEEEARAWGRPSPKERGAVGRFHVESAGELSRLSRLAREVERSVSVAIRINPNVDAATHEYTTTGTYKNKFGVLPEEALRLAEEVASDPWLRFEGLHAHIGSPVRSVEPYRRTVLELSNLKLQLEKRGIRVSSIDLGGGWPVAYHPEDSFSIADFANSLLMDLKAQLGSDTQLLLEPGRYLVARSGILVTQVTTVKSGGPRTFVVVDAGMHSLIRPALYAAYHFLWPVVTSVHPDSWDLETGPIPPPVDLSPVDVVGPLCETGDFLARARPLPPVTEGALLALFDAGAYGMSMASNYNLQVRPAEVLVEGKAATLIRRRETLSDLFQTVAPPSLSKEKTTR